MTFAAGLLVLIWVAGSILANGIALLHYSTKLRGLDLLGYGAAAGVALHALLGWAIAAFPGIRAAFVGILIALSLASAIYIVRKNVLQEFSLALSRSSKVSLALWALLLLLCLGLPHLVVNYPDPLPDGRYVFKTHTANVKIQLLTALPADNYIPFAVSEFFLRGISFRKARPILPGNEVSNRTILMSLVTLPFRVALGAPHDRPKLGTFRYLDQEWPDVSKLNSGTYFEQFLVVGFFLNSLLLVGILVFITNLGGNSILPLATIVYLTNPYFLNQTLFTWPKALAGFFIILAWTSIRLNHRPLVVAGFMALAYHSHPYAIVFALFLGLFYAAQCYRRECNWSTVTTYIATFALLLLPWIIWTKLSLRIPSDLMAQNFAGAQTADAWASPAGFVWVRLHNVASLLSPMMFLSYPFNLSSVLDLQVCLPGVLGLVVIYPAFAQCAELPGLRNWLWYGLAAPALSILILFSYPSPVALHGYQSIVGVLLFFGVWWLSRHTSRAVFLSLVSLQLAMNLTLILARAVFIGARFW